MVKGQCHEPCVEPQSVKLLSHGGKAQHPQAAWLTADPKRSHGHPLPDPSMQGFIPTQASALAKGQALLGGQLHTAGPPGVRGHQLGTGNGEGFFPALGPCWQPGRGQRRREAGAPGGAGRGCPRSLPRSLRSDVQPWDVPPPVLRLRFCN